MITEKILIAYNGELYYPFDENNVWIFSSKEDRWKIVPRPEFLVFLPENNDLVEMLDDCICNSRDLFNFGCRC